MLELIKIIISAAGGIGALLAFHTKVVIPWLIKQKQNRKNKEEMYEKIQSIYDQILPNSGSSIAETINRMANRIVVIEQTTKALMGSLAIGYWKCDATGLCNEISKDMCWMLGRAENELIGNNWIGLLDRTDKERIFNAWQFSIENNTTFNEEYTFIKTDGSKIKVNGVAYQLYDDQRNLIGFFGTIKKID